MKPPTGFKGTILRAIVDAPGLTVAGYAEIVAPARPRFSGPVMGAEDWRRRQSARHAWAVEVEGLRPKVSKAVRRLQSDGWVLPGSVARLTPSGRSALCRASGDCLVAVQRAHRIAILCDELAPESRQWDVGAVARVMAALLFRETGRAETATRLRVDSAGHAFRVAWDAGSALGLWWLPSQRLPSVAAVDVLGGVSPFVRVREAV